MKPPSATIHQLRAILKLKKRVGLPAGYLWELNKAEAERAILLLRIQARRIAR
jgi:hypothetical protein